jgi:hypothetical protein
MSCRRRGKWTAALALTLYAACASRTRTDFPAALSRDPPVPIEVIVKLLATAANEPDRRALDDCAGALRISIAPLHPGTTDRDLASYFVTFVEAPALDDVLARLRRCPGVDGAYAKPAGEPPERM